MVAGTYDASVHRWPPSPADLRPLPKAELHQHLDGALRPATAVELADEIGLALSAEEAVARLVAPARCHDQAALLTYFDLPIALLQTADALRRAAAELVEDMAADAAGLLDALSIQAAHLVGISLGGMVAQVVAARHPERARSLVSIMSTTGNVDLPRPKLRVLAQALRKPRRPSRDEAVEHIVQTFRVIGSPGYPATDTYLRTLYVHGARSLLKAAAQKRRAGHPLSALAEWALQLEARRGFNKATVGLANKLARIVWATWRHGRVYDANWVRRATTVPV